MQYSHKRKHKEEEEIADESEVVHAAGTIVTNV